MEKKALHSYIDTWPAWLSMDERERIKRAVQGDRTGAAITAACLYLGLSPESAAKMTTGRAYGDALENRTQKAFLHIPDEYRRMIDPPEGKAEGANTKITTCPADQAGAVIERVFIRAGIDPENAAQRLRRTAAMLHFSEKWTPKAQIEKWFAADMKQARPGEPGAAYYRVLATKEQQQAIDDMNILKMGGILCGKK